MKKIVIFASGSGTNMQRLADFFADDAEICIEKLYCNRIDAFVLERARRLGIPSRLFNRHEFYDTDVILNDLLAISPDLIVLAGFLWKVPESIIRAFPSRIVNIHPALLPKYGGKGMYGHHVHSAVVANGEKESGITIHYVNENYDEGAVIVQARCTVAPDDTADSLAAKIHLLEYEHFPLTVEKLLR